MFNVIKGQYINQSTEPVLIKRDVGKVKIDKSKEEVEKEKKIVELERLDERIKNKKDEINKLDQELKEKKQRLNSEADTILKEAHEKAKYELDVSRNRGYQDGYQDGEKKGIENSIEKASKLIEKAQNIVDETIEIKQESIKNNENDLISLAIDIAKSVIKKEIIEDVEIAEKNIKAALNKVPISKNLKIIINWKDMDHIKEIKDELISEIHGVENIEIVEDRNIEKGGAVLETSIGTIDAAINSQLKIIYEKLQETENEDDIDIIEVTPEEDE